MKPKADTVRAELKPYANPYLIGVLLGLVLLASFVILGAGLGASGGIAHIGASLSMSVSELHTLSSEYFGKWGSTPLNYYLVFMFVGILSERCSRRSWRTEHASKSNAAPRHPWVAGSRTPSRAV